MDTTKGGPISLEHDVIYTYAVTNYSTIPVVDVTVDDDKLGPVPGSPVAKIEPGETVVLKAVALISEETTNVVTVNGRYEDGRECSPVTAEADVVIEQPAPVCDAPLSSLLLKYVGPEMPGPVTIEIVPRKGSDYPVTYSLPDGLPSGTMVQSPTENEFTIAAAVRGEDELGSKTTITLNGVEEVLHTSCSVPISVFEAAPLDDPKGAPSPNWVVMGFTEK